MCAPRLSFAVQRSFSATDAINAVKVVTSRRNALGAPVLRPTATGQAVVDVTEASVAEAAAAAAASVTSLLKERSADLNPPQPTKIPNLLLATRARAPSALVAAAAAAVAVKAVAVLPAVAVPALLLATMAEAALPALHLQLTLV